MPQEPKTVNPQTEQSAAAAMFESLVTDLRHGRYRLVPPENGKPQGWGWENDVHRAFGGRWDRAEAAISAVQAAFGAHYGLDRDILDELEPAVQCRNTGSTEPGRYSLYCEICDHYNLIGGDAEDRCKHYAGRDPMSDAAFLVRTEGEWRAAHEDARAPEWSGDVR